jgi:hypothetical protein
MDHQHSDADVLSEAGMDENMGAGVRRRLDACGRILRRRRISGPAPRGLSPMTRSPRGPMEARVAEGRLSPMGGADGRPMDEAAGEARAERKNNLDSGLSA